MQPLLNIPENIILKNRAGVTQLVKHYINKEWDEIDYIPVTYNFEEEPVSYFFDERWDLSAYVDVKITHKTKLSFLDIQSQDLIREFKLICFSLLYVAGNARITRPKKTPSLLLEVS